MRWTGAKLRGEVRKLAFLRLGPRLLVGRQRRVRIWDGGCNQFEGGAFAVGRSLTHLGADDDGQSWMLCADGRVEVMRPGGRVEVIRPGDLKGSSDPEGPNLVFWAGAGAAALSGGGARLATAGSCWVDGEASRLRVSLCDASDAAELAALMMDRDTACKQLVLSPDGGTVALPLTYGRVLIWEPSPTPGQPVVPDEFHLGTSAGGDGWQSSARSQRDPLRHDKATRASALSFSADGGRLAMSSGALVLLRDVATGERICTFVGHEATVTAVAFPPAGPLLASVSEDGTFRLWDAAAEHRPERLCLDCGLGALFALAFSPDGQLAAVGGGRGAKLFELDERVLS